MKKRKGAAVFLATALWLGTACADTIYFKDGKVIETPSAWEDGDSIACERFGGVINYPKSKIDHVEHSNAAPAEPAPQAAAAPAGESGSILGDVNAPDNLAEYLARKVPPRNRIEEAGNATVTIYAFSGTGSGFFITPDGYILTNRHVVEGAGKVMEAFDNELRKEEMALEQTKRLMKLQGKLDDDVRSPEEERYENDLKDHEKKRSMYQEAKSGGLIVILSDGTKLWAPIVSISETYDLALLKIDGHRTPYLTPSQDRIAQGDTLYAIGSPLNLARSVSSGIYSGEREGYIQTNVTLNPGNSGGPLITRDGGVLGINTAKISGAGIEGLSFSIPIVTALREFGPLRRQYNM